MSQAAGDDSWVHARTQSYARVGWRKPCSGICGNPARRRSCWKAMLIRHGVSGCGEERRRAAGSRPKARSDMDRFPAAQTNRLCGRGRRKARRLGRGVGDSVAPAMDAGVGATITVTAGKGLNHSAAEVAGPAATRARRPECQLDGLRPAPHASMSYCRDIDMCATVCYKVQQCVIQRHAVTAPRSDSDPWGYAPSRRLPLWAGRGSDVCCDCPLA